MGALPPAEVGSVRGLQARADPAGTEAWAGDSCPWAQQRLGWLSGSLGRAWFSTSQGLLRTEDRNVARLTAGRQKGRRQAGRARRRPRSPAGGTFSLGSRRGFLLPRAACRLEASRKSRVVRRGRGRG